MTFKPGDRVFWRTDPRYVGTVAEVIDDRLAVYWDHHTVHETVTNYIDCHALLIKEENFDGFEVDA